MNSPYKKAAAGISVLLAVIVLIAAIQTHAGADESPPAVVSQTVNGLNAEMQFGTYPVKRLQNNDFTVILTDSEGKPASRYNLRVRLSMSNMMCGDVSFMLKETAPGVYTGEAVPLMAGLWDADVEAHDGDRVVNFSRTLEAEAAH
ncbi:FixH family protein [Paenibacillus mendelii]|uniref:FixH family protein n=1 Tax=Paenibacillus mendelii TaxID=206163 RepID=A0ABV6JG91_9BACL|nr:FixH family protein [Paenibacillus mendelii]MCQ6557816.1 FixH family protein [Paenibacillus mendelii]